MPRDLSEEFLTLHEFVAAARARLDDNSWNYLIGGTETETTVRRNRLALDSLALRPRVLRDVSAVEPGGTLMGRPVRLPVLLAPVGGLEFFDPDGAVAVARAAGEFGVGTMVSSVSPRTKAEIRAATDAPALFQLYVRGRGRFIEEHVEATLAAGMEGFCLTVDTAHYSRRERDIAQRFVKPWRAEVDVEARTAQMALSWADVARVRRAFDIPLILKGIATPEDARIAVEHGVDVVYVSNHGGRQLDHGLGALDALPEIAGEVGDRARIWVDGGICRGTDIIKALCLGAEAVGLGRLYCYALAVAGSAGVVRLLEILEKELVTSLGLLGVTRLAELGPAYVRRGAPSPGTGDVLGAFPLLGRDDPAPG